VTADLVAVGLVAAGTAVAVGMRGRLAPDCSLGQSTGR
jgi:hypothetical protein